MTVARVITETSDATTFVLNWPEAVDYRPGQFITVRIPSERTGSVARSYSLSSAPGVDPLPAITVKRTAGGYGSNWLCDNVRAGTSLRVLAPAGVFTPAKWRSPLRLFAAGSGITPVMSILKYALSLHSCRVELFYANRDRESIIFADSLAELADRYADRFTLVHWLESDCGLPTPEAIGPWTDADIAAAAFICGPTPFMELVESALHAAGAPATAVHVERYVSLTGDPFTLGDPQTDVAAATLEVSIDGDSVTVLCGQGTRLLDAMLAHGVDAPYSCREGDCGSCMARLIEGVVEPGGGLALEPEDIADGYILTCQAFPRGESVSIEFE
ncbi:MAG: ferredoxin--NADP reductase [Gordonia sp. (in: high G+C Gram-positive bacteria)]